jgi:hypothetical protein
MALEFYMGLRRAPLARQVDIYATAAPPIVVAMDGRLDESDPPTVGAALYDAVTRTRRALVAEVDRDWWLGGHTRNSFLDWWSRPEF